jgi:hypothetical protein
VKISVGIGAGRHADQYRGDFLGMQASQHEALLPTHAASGEDDGFDIPVGPRQQVVQRRDSRRYIFRKYDFSRSVLPTA